MEKDINKSDISIENILYYSFIFFLKLVVRFKKRVIETNKQVSLRRNIVRNTSAFMSRTLAEKQVKVHPPNFIL